MKCSECRFFEDLPEEYGRVNGIMADLSVGHCSRWRQEYDSPQNPTSNMCWVESDEGWANIVGPDFGCVLFEKNN